MKTYPMFHKTARLASSARHTDPFRWEKTRRTMRELGQRFVAWMEYVSENNRPCAIAMDELQWVRDRYIPNDRKLSCHSVMHGQFGSPSRFPHAR